MLASSPITFSNCSAIFGAMETFPEMTSLMSFAERPHRRASSACEMPWAARRSSMIQPGGTAWSGRYWLVAVAMFGAHSVIVDDFDDDRGHVADVDTAVRQARHRIVVGLENEPVRGGRDPPRTDRYACPTAKDIELGACLTE